MNWLRRLLGQPCRRGTLILLDNDIAIVGFPPDLDPSPEQAAALADLLHAWRAEDRAHPLVLPWPVDVTDDRGKVYERVK